MSSQRRIEASRANGARSRGPVTAEGKLRSANNAIRHGLLAQTVVLQDEDAGEFQAVFDGLVARFQPADDVELALVEEMAAAQWRKRRSWAIETAMMDGAAAGAKSNDPVARMTHAFTTLAAGPELALMHRYETRQTRMYQRALHSLILLRKSFLPNEPNPEIEHGQDISDPVAPPDTPSDTPAPVAGNVVASRDAPKPPSAFDPLAEFSFEPFSPSRPPGAVRPQS
jgi:hypothetical protein